MTGRLLPCALVIAAALLACWPAHLGSFIYDDQYYVLQNPAVTGTASPFTTPLGAEAQALWRPLTVASYRAQWDGTGRAGPFLAANIALHVAVALLVLALGRRLGLGGGGSLIAGLLFACHPVHAEAVAWVSGRAELLAALFVLASWRAHLSDRRGAGWLSALLFFLALLSKENALVAPALFAIADAALGRRPLPWRRWLVLAALAAGAWCARLAVLETALPMGAPFGNLPLPARGLVAAGILGRALGLLAWPWPQRVFFPRDEFLAPDPLAICAVIGAALLVALLWRRQRATAVALLLVPGSLLTVLNLVPIGATFALRFLYLPSAFCCLAAGALLAALGRRERASGRGLGASLALVVLLLAVAIPACRTSVRVFHDDLSLWAHDAAVAPQVAHARYNHGYSLHAAGRDVTEAADRPGAEDELLASLRLDPGHLYGGFARVILGDLALQGAGRAAPNLVLAARRFREAIARQSTPVDAFLDARINLAGIALLAPQVVSPDEARRLLAGLPGAAGAAGLRPEQQRTVDGLRAQLDGEAPTAAPPGPPSEPATGTSSPDGS